MLSGTDNIIKNHRNNSGISVTKVNVTITLPIISIIKDDEKSFGTLAPPNIQFVSSIRIIILLSIHHQSRIQNCLIPTEHIQDLSDSIDLIILLLNPINL